MTSIKDKLSGNKGTAQKTPAVSQPPPRAQPSAAPKQTLTAHPGLKDVKNIIAVAAGKGGVGKSTVSVNLAYSLAKTGAKVGILDADVYGPSIPTMVKIDAPPATQGQMIIPPKANGVKIVSIAFFGQANQASILRGPMAGNVVKQFLTQVEWGELDYLIVDYPPGTGDIQLTISQTAPLTGAVVVTTPQEVAVIDVRKAISMFKTMKVPVLGVVETMSYFQPPGHEQKYRIFGEGGGARLAKENGISLLGEIPIDPEIAKGSDSGEPYVVSHPDSAIGKAFMDLATKTANQTSKMTAASNGGLNHFSLEWT